MLKVAETFTSVQGEGTFSGVLTFFVRLAGCNVGRQMANPIYSHCESIDGSRFVCDTDFRAKKEMTTEELIEAHTASGAPQICVSGGEPMLQVEDLQPFFHALPAHISVSLETSGTIELKPVPTWVYVTCSPKRGFLSSNIRRIDEFKLLIDQHTDLDNLAAFIKHLNELNVSVPIYLMPINGIYEINSAPVENCMKLLRDFPKCRLGVQMHKVYGVR